ncbi:MAG: sulfurtransferase TusA family protein [Rhodospirillales bacterium]|jgi:tRNA 2-thiouridine synthesizing protein A|nr:sulfurtransferase TusA family protein [Rhodospirillales bacterium]MDP6773282.1 sulfurtransferase TusA family protein [Rhodospirillales bacterium]
MGLFGSKKTEESTGGEARQVTLEGGATITVAKSVDCLGDSCPRPQIMTKKAVEGVASGEVVEVVIDNPPSMEAIPPLCPDIGATHLETRKAKNCWEVYVRKD